jgi:hypothetical protein
LEEELLLNEERSPSTELVLGEALLLAEAMLDDDANSEELFVDDAESDDEDVPLVERLNRPAKRPISMVGYCKGMLLGRGFLFRRLITTRFKVDNRMVVG